MSALRGLRKWLRMWIIKKGFWHSGQVHKRSVISNRLCHETHTTQERPSAYTEWSTASGTFIALPWRWRNPHDEGENLVINNSYIRHLKCSSQRENAIVLHCLSKRNYLRVIRTARERLFQNKEVAMNIWDFGTFSVTYLSRIKGLTLGYFNQWSDGNAQIFTSSFQTSLR